MTDDTRNNEITNMSSEEHAQYEKNINKVSEQLGVSIEWARAIKPEEILYLLDHCPFLQIVNPDAGLPDSNPVQVKRANSSNWDIHDYGDAMSSSPGRLLYGGGFYRVSLNDDEDDEGSGIVNPGKGTIVNQAFNTAMEMVTMAAEAGWSRIRIVDGHPLMNRAAWIKASELSLGVQGFTPSAKDNAIRKRVGLSPSDLEVLRKEIRPSAS